MMTFKRMVGLGVLGLLGALAFAVPAQAEIKADCVISGVAKTFDKDAPFDKKAVEITGGSGKFEFASLFIGCIGTEKSTVPEVVVLDVVSSGWFDNVLCVSAGSKAYGEEIVVQNWDGGTEDYGAVLADEKYKVVFTAPGHGDFYWHEWDKPKMPDPKDVIGDLGDPQDEKKPAEQDWQLAGAIQLGFNVNDDDKPFVPPDPLINTCVDSFTVEGVIHVDPRTE